MTTNNKEVELNSNLIQTVDSLEKSYHRNLPIDEFLTYLTTSQKKTQIPQNSQNQPKYSPRGFSCTGNYYELKNQIMPEGYIATTSNNNLTNKKQGQRGSYYELDIQNDLEGEKQSDSDSSALEISIIVDQEDSQVDMNQPEDNLKLVGERLANNYKIGASVMSKSPQNPENNHKIQDMCSFTSKTYQNVTSERTQSHTEFRLTDRTKTQSIPFQVSRTTYSSHNSDEEEDCPVHLQEEINSVGSKNPFCRSGQIYQHSSHIKSLDSHSSDDYDNEGTSSKRKKLIQVRELKQKNMNQMPSTRLFKNMFNDQNNSDLFNVKRSLPNTGIGAEKQKLNKARRSKELIENIVVPNFFKTKKTLKSQMEGQYGYSSEKISNYHDQYDSSDKENSYYHLAVQSNNIHKEDDKHDSGLGTGSDQFDKYLVNNNIDLTSIKKKEHNSISCSLKFSSGTVGAEFKDYDISETKKNSPSTTQLKLVAVQSNEITSYPLTNQDYEDIGLETKSSDEKREIFLKMTQENDFLLEKIREYEAGIKYHEIRVKLKKEKVEKLNKSNQPKKNILTKVESEVENLHGQNLRVINDLRASITTSQSTPDTAMIQTAIKANARAYYDNAFATASSKKHHNTMVKENSKLNDTAKTHDFLNTDENCESKESSVYNLGQRGAFSNMYLNPNPMVNSKVFEKNGSKPTITDYTRDNTIDDISQIDIEEVKKKGFGRAKDMFLKSSHESNNFTGANSNPQIYEVNSCDLKQKETMRSERAYPRISKALNNTLKDFFFVDAEDDESSLFEEFEI